jgi:hypothetical protein
MSIYYEAAVSPDDATAFVREVPVTAGRRLLALFGEFETADDNTIDFAEIIHTNRTARYRSFDGRVHVSERDAGSQARVPMLPLSSSLGMGEYERLQLQFARTGGTYTAALANAIYNDAANLTNEVLNRLELAVGDELSDGKLTMNAPGEPGAEADFGVPGNQLITPSTAWTDTTNSTPLSDMIAGEDVYQAAGNAAGGSYLSSRKYIRLLCQNKEFINASRGSAAGVSRITPAEVNDVLAANDLPTLLPSFDESLDVDGTSTRVIADNKFIRLPENPEDLLKVRMGVSATALELVNSKKAELSFEDAPGIVGVVEKADGVPYREFTYVDAVGMPYLKVARRLMVFTVGA